MILYYIHAKPTPRFYIRPLNHFWPLVFGLRLVMSSVVPSFLMKSLGLFPLYLNLASEAIIWNAFFCFFIRSMPSFCKNRTKDGVRSAVRGTLTMIKLLCTPYAINSSANSVLSFISCHLSLSVFFDASSTSLAFFAWTASRWACFFLTSSITLPSSVSPIPISCLPLFRYILIFSSPSEWTPRKHRGKSIHVSRI